MRLSDKSITVSALSVLAVTAGIALAATVSPAWADSDASFFADAAPSSVSNTFADITAAQVDAEMALPVTVEPGEQVLADTVGGVAPEDSGAFALIVASGLAVSAAGAAVVWLNSGRRRQAQPTR